MPATPRPTLLGALRFGSDSGDSTDEHSFLQERVALFALVGALVGLGFFVVGNGVGLTIIPEYTLAEFLGSAGNRLHAGAVAIGLLFWALLRRGRPRLFTLVGADLTLTLSILAAYGGMVLTDFSRRPGRVDMTMLLITMVVLTLRSVLIPSTPLQTLVVSAIGVVPALVVGAVVGSAIERVWIFTAQINSVLWSLTIIVVSTLTSRIIYGLRRNAAEARRLGQYLLGEKIGEGGMGTVYRARHALLRRPTAIKLLPMEKVGAQAIARFEREVQHTSSLTHPNTVSIYDYGRTPDGVFYYAMEYLDGVDLQDLVDQTGPQDPRRVVHILKQVAGALSEAHSLGLVHRDVKPANIVLCDRGGVRDTVKVFDFGLVKDITSTDVSSSTVATIIGTPLYMAPEAVTAPEAVGPSADLYALGAVAYFLLTGVPPFEGQSVVEVCSQHVHQAPVPPSVKLGRGVPAELERIVLGCLAKKPDARPASARALAAELETVPLAPWTEADAEAFYAAHPIQKKPPLEMATTTVVSIDLTQRAAE